MYRLDRKNPIAPEPDQNNFGETDDFAVVEALLEEASGLIDGQKMVWNSDIQLRPGSKLQYYYDETITPPTAADTEDFIYVGGSSFVVADLLATWQSTGDDIRSN